LAFVPTPTVPGEVWFISGTSGSHLGWFSKWGGDEVEHRLPGGLCISFSALTTDKATDAPPLGDRTLPDPEPLGQDSPRGHRPTSHRPDLRSVAADL